LPSPSSPAASRCAPSACRCDASARSATARSSAAVALTIALQLALVALPFARDVLGLEPLDAGHRLLIAAIAIGYLASRSTRPSTAGQQRPPAAAQSVKLDCAMPPPEQHTPAAVRTRLTAPPRVSYLRDFIYGAIDGAVTTFAVVAGVEGADLSANIVIILGIANLVADGFSMAASNYLGSRAEAQQREQARRREQRQIELMPEGEREEIRQIYAAKGFTGHDLEQAVAIITSDKEVWLKTMMREELGYGSDATNPLRAAASTLVAFITVGFLPLGAFVYNVALADDVASPFAWSAVLTGLAFLAVGALKARVVDQPAWRSALETLTVGGAAALLAYILGSVLQRVA
jgi:VIT1/CCC1 family predicted Fe2+/Mn2+ transporter